jgi:hypothetical protein
VATIDPNQQYDIIHTLTFAEASGDCPIRLHRGSVSTASGTVYYRAGTSGDWTSLSVSGTATTFPVTDTTMQVAHNWNKSGNNYMTPSFYNAKTITSIAISQKSPLTGTMGTYFMYYYAYGCSSLESLDVPDTSGLTSVGASFMYSYARGCSSLTSLAVPDTSGLTSVGNSFMAYYARDCSPLTELVLPAVGWFEDHNVNWSVPSGRLGNLKGRVLNSDDLSGWKALTASGKTLHTNYIRDPELVYCYDIIHTLTFSEASGTCPIRLYRGSSTAYSGTIYYRAGTSGDWTTLSVSGTDTTFPVTSTTMQVAHNWNKSGNNYMTPSFRDATNITSISISQKSSLTGIMGNYFMSYYAYGCSKLTSLDAPDTSSLESVGDYFMYYYARGCSSLTSLTVPDTSGLTSVGTYFMRSYAEGCSSLESLDVPDTSGLTSVGTYFMAYYAEGCSSLESLDVPDTSGLTSVGTYFMAYYASDCSSLTSLAVPDTSSLTSVGTYFMLAYA